VEFVTERIKLSSEFLNPPTLFGTKLMIPYVRYIAAGTSILTATEPWSMTLQPWDWC
jgi:hypothetical protein